MWGIAVPRFMFYNNYFQGTRKLLRLIMKFLLGCLSIVICLAIPVAIACALAAWLCDIEPDKTYTWYSGIWHGLFCIPNWIRSFFDSECFVKPTTTLRVIIFGGGLCLFGYY